MKKEIITIAGTLGSGKSSTADMIAKKLGYNRFSSGDFMRKIALEMGISLNELSVKAQTDDSIDKKIDAAVQEAGKLNKKIVVDSRLAFHWIPKSFKVYLNLPPEIAKERIFGDLQKNQLRKESEKATTSEEIYGMIRRRRSEEDRYKKLYGIDHTDRNNFDLIIDTEKNNLEQVVDIIIEEYKKWLAN